MKYIIELEDEPRKELFADAGNYYRCKQRPFWFISEDTRDSLTPYTEPDRKAIEDEVWEFAGRLYYSEEYGGMNNKEFRSAFYGESAESVALNMSYQEAKAKYDKWNDEIRVGDEVEAEPGNKACVLYENPDGTQAFVFKADGSVAWWSKCTIHKTGRRFSEVAELLKKMKE